MKLKDKVQLALDESRMLIMGVQMLLGFDLQVFLMRSFDALRPSAQAVKLASLGLQLVTVTLLFMQVARHRIVERGTDTESLHRFSRATATLALLPFAASLACEVYVAAGRIMMRSGTAALCAAFAGIATLLGWYVGPWLARRRKRSEDDMEKTKLEDKIRQVLTEARVVLPGTQALVGFQLAGVMQDTFDALPASSKAMYLAALAFLGISVILLMLPAAYHRIAVGGEVDDRLLRVASASVLAAMAALGTALALDTCIVVRKATGSAAVAVVAAAAWLSISFGTWFVAMWVIRARAHGLGVHRAAGRNTYAC